jgi:hypothetical protein
MIKLQLLMIIDVDDKEWIILGDDYIDERRVVNSFKNKRYMMLNDKSVLAVSDTYLSKII